MSNIPQQKSPNGTGLDSAGPAASPRARPRLTFSGLLGPARGESNAINLEATLGVVVVSLFAHQKFDSLTVEYRDSNGGLHAAIFRLPRGHAAAAKKQLIAMGAKASTPVKEIPASDTKDATKKEKK